MSILVGYFRCYFDQREQLFWWWWWFFFLFFFLPFLSSFLSPRLLLNSLLQKGFYLRTWHSVVVTFPPADGISNVSTLAGAKFGRCGCPESGFLCCFLKGLNFQQLLGYLIQRLSLAEVGTVTGVMACPCPELWNSGSNFCLIFLSRGVLFIYDSGSYHRCQGKWR